MRNLIILIVFALSSYKMSVLAQAKSQDPVYADQPKNQIFTHPIYTDPVYTKVDTYPVYTGGFVALEDFLKKNLKTVTDGGHVIATFVVEKDGSLSNIEVVRSFSDQAAAEAIRVIKLMPKWKPGILDNHVVRTQYTIPISFNK